MGGGQGGHIPSRHMTSTPFRRHVPTRFLINRCQIITFLILISDIIENSRIELRVIVLTVPSNQISYICFYSTLQLGTFVIFSCFTLKLKKQVGGLLEGGGPKGYVGPLSNYWEGGWPGPPLPTPMPGTSEYHRVFRNMTTDTPEVCFCMVEDGYIAGPFKQSWE